MKNKAAQELGRKGGKVSTEAKAEAARANGSKGGRPISQALLARASAVGLMVSDTRADDGTYWIHNTQSWRSISWVRAEISRRAAEQSEAENNE